MTHLADVTRHLDALEHCAGTEIHAHLSPALRQFRFLPSVERRACADAFHGRVHARVGAAPVLRGYAVFLQAMDRFIDEEHEAALRLLVQSRAAFAEHDDPVGLGLSAMLIGAVYRTFGNFDLALKILWEGYALLAASGLYPVFLAATANSMANIDLDMGNLDEAMAMFTVAHEQSTGADDFYFTIYALHGLGRVHARLAQPAKAEEMFEQALRLAEQHAHPLHIANSLTEIATLRFDVGRLDEAESLSARALAIREQHHLLGGAVTNCLRLAEIHGRRGRWADALPLLSRGMEIAEALRVKPKMAQVHLLLAELYEQTHELERSLLHYKRYHALREEVEREDGARKLADARLIFEAEQTRKENVVIKEQKAEIERKNIALQETIDELTRAKIGRKAKAFTLGIAIILFIFQDAILGTALRLLPSDNYFLLLAVKMGIIFSLSPINRGIEHHLLKKVLRKGRAAAAGPLVEGA